MSTETETTENLKTQATNGVEEDQEELDEKVTGEEDLDLGLYRVAADTTRITIKDGHYKFQVEFELTSSQASRFIDITKPKPGSCLLDISGFQLPLAVRQPDGQILIPEYAYQNPDQEPTGEKWEYAHVGGDAQPLAASTEEEFTAESPDPEGVAQAIEPLPASKEWENAQELSGFKVGEEVVQKDGGELGIIQGIEGHRLRIIGGGGVGTMSLLYPGQVEHKPTDSKGAKKKRRGKKDETQEPAESVA